MPETRRGAGLIRPDLGFLSSSPSLNEGFEWAVKRSLEWVRTDPAELPSYWAGLTDRPLFYSRDIAHQLLGAHLLGLDEQNLAMMRTFAASATPARRYYPLWSFTFTGQPGAIDYNSDEHFVREIPAVYELVEKALEQYLWSGDRRWIQDPDLARFRRTTVREFTAEHDVLGLGLAGETGTGDLFRGLASYNEQHRGDHPLIAADGVATQWAALEAISTIFGPAVVAGVAEDDSLVAEARAAADRIAHMFAREWWSENDNRFASGRTADQYDTGLAWEPSWYPALKGLLPSGPRAEAHLQFLAEQLRATPPVNIEGATYLPEVFSAYHHDAEAMHWIEYLIASRADYPEVPFTVVSHLTVGLAGLRPTGQDAIETDSHLPSDQDWATAENVPVGPQRIDIHTRGRQETRIALRKGPHPLRWRARFGNNAQDTIIAPGETKVLTAL
jgi:hypothetical protein